MNNNKRQYVKRVQWNKATADNIAHYKHILDELCAQVKLPLDALYCQDTSCMTHSNALNVYCNNIIDVCLLASDMCIPNTKKKGIAGWSDRAVPARNEAIFWHRLWVDNGRPSQCHIADIRRRTRYNYKRIVKMLKRNQNKK